MDAYGPTIHDRRIQEAAKKMIAQLQPDLWLTVTFRRAVCHSRAIKRFKGFFKHLNKKDAVFFRKSVSCWVYFDPNLSRTGCHLHALVRGIQPALASALERKCKEHFGQSKVVPFDHSRHDSAAGYLADKYAFLQPDRLEYFKINSHRRKFNQQEIGKPNHAGIRAAKGIHSVALPAWCV